MGPGRRRPSKQRAPAELVRGVDVAGEVELGPPAGHGRRPLLVRRLLLQISGWRGSCAAWETEEGGICRRSMAQVVGCEQQRRATAARVGRRFHWAAAAAVAMDLMPSSSLGGGEVETEDGVEER